MIDTQKPTETMSDALGESDALNGNDVGDVSNDTDTPKATIRKISISVRGLFITVIVGLVAVALGTLTWLYVGVSEQLDAQVRAAAECRHAEDHAMKYAVSAAGMDYQDFAAWKVKLVDGTSPALNEKLTKAAASMQQILEPLKWQSTARPLAAKVRSDAGGIYVVDAFVSVLTKTMQAPEGLLSTATYSITLDGKNNWQITDVGGVDSALGK